MTPLTSNAVTAMQVQASVLTLMNEFLGRYFDGAAHDVGGVKQVPFTAAGLFFQQSAVPQPLDGVSGLGSGAAITMVWNEGSGGSAKRKFWEIITDNTVDPPVKSRQEIVLDKVSWNFWVRANGTNAKKLAKQTADLLSGLLGNSAETRALAQKGIHRLRSGDARVVQETSYSLQLVTATAMLRYAILSQVGS